MIFEDLHWIDPSSRELLDRMIERIAGLPVLLLVTFRPEFAPPWSGLPQVTALTLARLDRRPGAAMGLGQATKEIAQIAAAIGREFSDELLAPVAERSEAELQEALGRLGEAGTHPIEPRHQRRMQRRGDGCRRRHRTGKRPFDLGAGSAGFEHGLR
jgi:predicted ATPase